MTKWLTGIRGALLMGAIWGVQWGLAGGFIEAFIDPRGEMVDMWPQTLAIPGFLVGLAFSAALQLWLRLRRDRRPAGGASAG